MNLKRLSQLCVTMLGDGMLCGTQISIFRELCCRTMSLPVGLRFQTDEFTPLLLRTDKNRNIFTVPKNVSSLDDLKLHRAVRKMEGETLGGTAVQQSSIEAFG